jgi:hypothetical protein
MTNSLELPTFDPAACTPEFYEGYNRQNRQLASMAEEDRTENVFAGIATLRHADGTELTYEQLRDKYRDFFNRDDVRQDMALMRQTSIQFAQFCMGHNHGSELARDEQLGNIFEHGINSIYGEKADHKHDLNDKHNEDKKRKKARNTGRQALRLVMGDAKSKKSSKPKPAQVIRLQTINSEVKQAA